MKVSESLEEAFLCGDSSDRQAATALAASEFDMATSDRWLSWRLSMLLAKAEYWAKFLRTSAAVNLTDFVSGDSSSPCNDCSIRAKK